MSRRDDIPSICVTVESAIDAHGQLSRVRKPSDLYAPASQSEAHSTPLNSPTTHSDSSSLVHLYLRERSTTPNGGRASPLSSPSEAENVRATYALLSKTGVPGDGFNPGIELTRERRGVSYNARLASSMLDRSSLPQSARSPSPNSGTGQLRQLIQEEGESAAENGNASAAPVPKDADATGIAPEELKFLQNADRFGFFSPAYSLAASHLRVACLPPKPFETLPHSNALRSKLPRRSVRAADGPVPSSPVMSSHEDQPPRSSLQDKEGFATVPPAGGLSDLNRSQGASTPRSRLRSAPGGMPTISRSDSQKIASREAARATKWLAMLEPAEKDEGGNVIRWKLKAPFAVNGKDHARFVRRVYKGIPDRWRAAVWGYLTDSFAERSLDTGRRPRQVESLPDLQKTFFNLIDVESELDVQIDLDVPRTISGHLLFHTRYGRGQRALFHVLHCFALHRPETSYCQGMGPIAATLLCYFEPERAFAELVRLHDSYGLDDLYSPGFVGLSESFYLQEKLVKLWMPEVARICDAQNVTPSSYATKWYITLFSNSIAFSTQVRIWDAMTLHGLDVLVLLSVAIIWSLRDRIVHPQANFETILSGLSSFFIVEDENALLRWIRKALTQPRLRQQLHQWRLDFRNQSQDAA
ncbi:uncharacterized protein L969DRAFT_74411 [Mixia osmundae IAM 14324]|uniref:Rab-GAP TBC domain-containing protein n=1 Tax=Mixia osmundae (strain CBS 9802 / IAM 14324 / JCM 22182 / KY 12970) TaxID=764103 RepID=G7E3E5_MIXOS|nr:uncharacterized protein L969DRAFT_74411 [Mixia osmundae IAM 14324]KEI39341.1 hypothetical protein L969DRAFT_74411 [Mixia osmundae IAM 14324]GAA97355.1 hypothetical protein E5Q_04033 [Mixia osmundae IAM 14324]